ncbi:hemolysin secretion protein D [Oceaniferula spumae]|uniref:Hemolysin secretion protein D n=1 Tax=Oceaniferula spumae TaxID=2979115 RepID=A0AAT9FSG1_9BACT
MTAIFKLTRLLLPTAVLIAGLHAQDAPRPVVVAKAEKASSSSTTTTLTGTVTSPRRANLSSRLEGLVTKVHVDAGSAVTLGQPLLQLDTKLAELDLQLLETQIAQAKIEQAEAERLVNEANRLAKSGAFPKSEAASRLTTLNVSGANLKQLNARKEQLQERIDRHQLLAPFAGVIVRKFSEQGEWVATGTPVLELIELENLRFDLQIPQEFLTRIQNAKRFTINLDAHPGKPLEAELAATLPVKDQTSRAFLTRLTLTDPDKLASPGMSGTATIESSTPADSSVKVPRDALVRFPDGTAKVWLVLTEGDTTKAISRTIQTAGSLGQTVTITEGLKGGETIIVKGNEGLSENQPVRVTNSQ